MRWSGYILLTLVVTVFALLIAMPADFVMRRVIAAEPSVRYVHASGTVWNGTVSGLRYGEQSIGNAQIETDWVSIFTGKLTSLVRVRDGAVNGRGRVSAGIGGEITVQDLRLSGSTIDLFNIEKEIRDLAGEYTISVRKAVISNGRCQSASGTAWTDLLTKVERRVDWKGPELTGPVSCREGRFVLALSGQSDQQEDVSAELVIGLDATGTFKADVSNAQRETGQALTLFGFLNQDDGKFVYEYQITG